MRSFLDTRDGEMTQPGIIVDRHATLLGYAAVSRLQAEFHRDNYLPVINARINQWPSSPGCSQVSFTGREK